jgi:hypothetical protein
LLLVSIYRADRRRETMSLQQQQEEFRQYLDDSGILKIIYQGLKAVYSQNPEDRPKDPLQ